jgi:predicted cobalt transporter CbtA
LFTRGVQANAGLGFGVLLFGVAMGALFAVAFCVVYARAKSHAPRLLSVQLAAVAFIAIYLVPFVKYPPNPPAVGQSDTIGERTGWYLVMVLISVVLAVAAVWLARRLVARFGTWNGGLLAGGAYLVVLAAVTVLLPTVDETPQPLRDAAGVITYPGFPADVLYEFRLVSLATQLVLWVTIGVVFATLAGRLLGDGGRALSGQRAAQRHRPSASHAYRNQRRCTPTRWTRAAGPANRRAPGPARHHRADAGRPGLRTVARRNAAQRPAGRPGGVAD